MSKFRKLVEDIVKPQPVYTYLTPDLQKALDKEIEKATERVDIQDLPSTYYDSNPYDVEPQLVGSSGGWFNDTAEPWNAGCDLLIDWVKADGAAQYLWDLIPEDKQEDDEFDQALTQEAITYIENQKVNN